MKFVETAPAAPQAAPQTPAPAPSSPEPTAADLAKLEPMDWVRAQAEMWGDRMRGKSHFWAD